MGDITALFNRKNRETTEIEKKVTMKKLKEEVEKKRLQLSVTENGKEGKSKIIASCGFLENELRQFSREEGVTLADGVGTLCVDSRTRVKRLGAEEKARRKKCKEMFSLTKKNKAFPNSYMKVGVKKLLRAGMMPARAWGIQAVGMSPTERVNFRRQMEAAAGKKEYDLLVFVHGSTRSQIRGEASHHGTQCWEEGVWTGNGGTTKRKRG